MRHLKGFTLIEMLMVMVIIGLLAGVALPRLSGLAQRYELAAQRKNLLIDIANLGYRAYLSGQAYSLETLVPPLPADTPLNVPADWKVEVQPPIQYSFNGICSGGQITLINPEGWREAFRLPPPQCQPTALIATP